jgi:hypothetical protein
VLGVRGTRFTLDGRPTFLLGVSYYGALGAPEEFVRRDLDDLNRHGFNWLCVWATWAAFDRDVSAVDAEGRPREPFLDRLRWLVVECDRRGLVVDVALTRGDRAARGALPNLEAHRRAVETVWSDGSTRNGSSVPRSAGTISTRRTSASPCSPWASNSSPRIGRGTPGRRCRPRSGPESIWPR